MKNAHQLAALSIAVIFLCLFGTADSSNGDQTHTLAPPSVYMNGFSACSESAACTRTAEFRVNPVPAGCCVLTVVNGDGRGNDEVISYEVFLNGEHIVQTTRKRYSQIAAKVAPSNTLKVVLVGKASSKVFVTFDFDPREAK